MEGIGPSFDSVLGERVPMYGGQLIECAITESGAVVRARDGWIIEMCDDALHIRRVGSSVHAHADRALFSHFGDEPPHLPGELEAANVLDRQNYREGMADLVRRHREVEKQMAVDAEFDRLFDSLKDYDDAPHVEYTEAVS